MRKAFFRPVLKEIEIVQATFRNQIFHEAVLFHEQL
jgi:hypothetical protein